MLAGQIMINSGAETHRVEDMATRMLKTTGFVHAEAFVLPTGIMLTLSDEKEETLSANRRVLPGANNFHRICSANNISRAFCDGKITLEEAKARLEKIQNEDLYPVWLKLLGTMLACGAFTVLFGGTMTEAAVAVICGLLVALINYFLRKPIGRDFICDALSAFTLSATSITVTYLFSLGGISLHAEYIIVGGIMPLVPGVAITNAIRDVLQGDYLSSCARIVEALMKAASVAIGVGAGIVLGNYLSLIPAEIGFSLSMTRTGLLGYAIGALAALGSVVGFSVILEVPKKHIIFSSLVAALGWITYLAAFYNGIAVAWASLFGTGIVELASYTLARLRKAPVTTFLIPGIITMVPGASIYSAAYGIIFSGTASALLDTVTIAGAIALGIIFTDTLMNILNKLKRLLFSGRKK